MANVDVALDAPRFGVELPAVRRFEMPDLTSHRGWMIERLLQHYPHLGSAQIHGWLSGLIYSPESLFLYQPNAVALAQVVSEETLAPTPVIFERFVWCKDPKDKEQQIEAAAFYDEFKRWMKNKGIKTMRISAQTDVPHPLIVEKLGRLFKREHLFATLG